MKHTYLQYEYRGKWIHIGWGKRFFASDEEHFDRTRNAIFGLKNVDHQLIYPEAAARLERAESNNARRIISLYAGLGAFDGLI